ncbi:MAG: DUF1549 domain-containing protein [Pirellulaceae bacterium]
MSPEADRSTLARRAALVLTGLPPEPEQLAAFLADDSPQAYERYVDQLLASPRFGEHQARRYWLDAVRCQENATEETCIWITVEAFIRIEIGWFERSMKVCRSTSSSVGKSLAT